MHMSDLSKLEKDWKHNIKSQQSSLIKLVYFKNEIVSINVSKTKTYVFIVSFEMFSLEFINIYILFLYRFYPAAWNADAV